MPKTRTEQLKQLTKATWDGDLISKSDREELVKCGYVFKVNGWNLVTENGLRVAHNLKLISV
jgi:hypothetical protein